MRNKVVALLVAFGLVVLASANAFAATEKFTGTVKVMGTAVHFETADGKNFMVTPNEMQKELSTMNGKTISVEGSTTGTNLTITKIEKSDHMGGSTHTSNPTH